MATSAIGYQTSLITVIVTEDKKPSTTSGVKRKRIGSSIKSSSTPPKSRSLVSSYSCSSSTSSSSSSSLSTTSTSNIAPFAVARRNERERNRVKMVNLGFNTLREHIPKEKQNKNKKMSKVETLREAANYIRRLQLLLKGDSSSLEAFSSVLSSMSPLSLQSTSSISSR